MAWRYQPIFYKCESGETAWGICEVYLDGQDRLTGWSGDRHCIPVGNNLYDLSYELMQLLIDCWRWVPVDYDKLKTGMVFHRAITREQCEALAKMVEGWAHNVQQSSSNASFTSGKEK